MARHNVNYTYPCDTTTCYSKIDHVKIRAPLQLFCCTLKTIDSPDDFSDHFSNTSRLHYATPKFKAKFKQT